jgi:AraC family transcriptional regulator, positive regulator of tynA and feaB
VVASGGLGALNSISATAYRLMSSAHRMIETTWPDPDFNAVSMAKALGVSRRTLDELFGRCGLTAEKAIRLRRIKEGARLLGAEVERMVLADVALRCGFADQSSFSKAFKHHYGLTPGQYRRDGSRALSQRGG